MHIILSPQLSDKPLTVSKQGDILTINGVDYDFTSMPDGATLPAEAINCEWLVGPVERLAGQLHLTLLLPVRPEASEAARFPVPLLDPADGLLELPL